MEFSQPKDIQLIDHLINHLISPNFIKDEQELLNFCGGAGFYPTGSNYAVIIVHIERWSDVFSTEAQWHETSKHHFFVLSNMLSEMLNDKNHAVVAEANYQQVCIVNVNESWDTFRQDIEPALRHMQEVLETEFNISVTIAVSPMVEGITALPEAYAFAGEVLWYNDFFGKDQQLLFYDDLCGETQPRIRSELMELDKKLIMKLQATDIAGIKYVLQETIDREFIQSTPTVQILRVRLGGICCKILDALDDLHDQLGTLYYRVNPGPRICEAQTLSELTGALGDIFDAILAEQNTAQQEPKPQWVDKMAVYINQHYTDENLGLTEVSAQFGITPSYATRVFKQYTGHGIYETIQHVRLAAAKDLLHTELTMKQIAQKVGYTSFLSMNRAFKKYEGTTPSQFRNQ